VTGHPVLDAQQPASATAAMTKTINRERAMAENLESFGYQRKYAICTAHGSIAGHPASQLCANHDAAVQHRKQVRSGAIPERSRAGGLTP
jgi:hypothetical protein